MYINIYVLDTRTLFLFKTWSYFKIIRHDTYTLMDCQLAKNWLSGLFNIYSWVFQIWIVSSNDDIKKITNLHNFVNLKI